MVRKFNNGLIDGEFVLAADYEALEKTSGESELEWQDYTTQLEARIAVLEGPGNPTQMELDKVTKPLHARISVLEKALDGVQKKLAEYLERLLQGRTLPNRWVGEINDIVQAAALAPEGEAVSEFDSFELQEAKLRIAVLEAALQIYGVHQVNCQIGGGFECTCGLSAALAPEVKP